MSKIKSNVKIVTSNYTTTDDDEIIIADSTGGNFTITLSTSPTPGSNLQIIKNVSTNIVLINGAEGTYLSNNTFASYTSINGSWVYKSSSKITSVTVSELQAIASGTALSTEKQYIVTNPQQGGSIYLKAFTTNLVDYNAIWLRPTVLYPFGWIRLTSGASGSVDSITVNGVAITTASVNFTTSLTNTATLVVANINANTATSGYKGVAIGDTIVVIRQSATTAVNGQTVSGTFTTITSGNIQNITNGQTSTTQALSVSYDMTSDRIRKAYDPIRDITISISERYRALFATDPFNDFRWGEDVFSTIKFVDTQIANNYGITGSQIRNIISDGGDFSNNLLSGVRIYNINLRSRNSTTTGFANFKNNLVLGTSSFMESCDVEFGIYNNILTGTSAFIRGIYQFCYSSNGATTSNIGVSGNILSGNNTHIDGITQTYNTGSNSMGVNNNIISGANSLIAGIVQQGYGLCQISGNTLSTSFQFIRSINQYGKDCTINSNTISSSTANSGIININQFGNACTLNNNTISNISVAGGGIFNINMFGAGCGINSMNFAVASNMSNIVLSANSAIITGYTFDATLTSISNIEWTAANTIIMNLQSSTLNGGTNNGLSGSNINIGLLPVAKAYPIRATFEGSGLTGVGASLQIGVETDDQTNIMPANAITGLNSISNTTITLSKSTVINRRIVAIPSIANITAGSFQVFVEFQVSKY